MAQTGSGLFRQCGKCARNPRRISCITQQLVFRGPEEKSAQNPKQISALCAELVFRQIPWDLVQRRRHPQRFGGWILRGRPLLNPVRGCILRVPPAPACLRLPTPGRLALRLTAGALSRSDSRVRPKPLPTYRARSLPALWHGELSCSPCRRLTLSGFKSGSVGQFCQARAGQFSRAP